MRVESVESLPYLVHPSRWLFIRACQEADGLFPRIADWVNQTFDPGPRGRGVVDYQRAILLLPEYDRDHGREFPVDADWPGYFAAARGREGFDSLQGPSWTPGASVRATDQQSSERRVDAAGPGESYYGRAFDWNTLTGEERLVRWIERTVLDRGSSRLNNLCNLEFRPRATE